MSVISASPIIYDPDTLNEVLQPSLYPGNTDVGFRVGELLESSKVFTIKNCKGVYIYLSEAYEAFVKDQESSGVIVRDYIGGEIRDMEVRQEESIKISISFTLGE